MVLLWSEVIDKLSLVGNQGCPMFSPKFFHALVLSLWVLLLSYYCWFGCFFIVLIHTM